MTIIYRADGTVYEPRGERMSVPRGWHEQADGSLVCPHRDLSVCPKCAAENPEAMDCYGVHFWIPISMRVQP